MALTRAFLVAAALCACATLRPGTEPTTLRVASYNIQAGGGNLSRTVDAIREMNADLVALQEVDVHWSERSQFADQARELGERLGMQVRFAPIYSLAPPEAGQPRREFGVALLTRRRIVSWRNDSLTRLSTQVADAAPARAPGLLVAIIDVDGHAVNVLTTHLDYRADPSVRRMQVAELVSALRTMEGPTIVAGDLNATPDAPELAPLLSMLRDSWPASNGPGFTYPAENPTKRIDYVLVSSHFRARSAAVPATSASDHRPVVVELLLR